ncbi:hypothetical protein DBT_2369 [Dissulfuribacter thermophilus]|uniref:Uncharacterized protein n=1 Tax=Dissulfuribacter thermophilus TaxID=1156395 RepID=A0A1B9F2R8_9BACT|nr:hypothetical protein DBT_2369 [Dissulfuribacter thermophilus]
MRPPLKGLISFQSPVSPQNIKMKRTACPKLLEIERATNEIESQNRYEKSTLLGCFVTKSFAYLKAIIDRHTIRIAPKKSMRYTGKRGRP